MHQESTSGHPDCSKLRFSRGDTLAVQKGAGDHVMQQHGPCLMALAPPWLLPRFVSWG